MQYVLIAAGLLKNTGGKQLKPARDDLQVRIRRSDLNSTVGYN